MRLGSPAIGLLAALGIFRPAPSGAAPWAYIANSGDTPGTVSVLDTATDAVVAVVPVGTIPAGVAVSPDGTRVYVAEFTGFSASTWVLDATLNRVIAQIGDGGESVAVSPDGSRLYIPNFPFSGLAVVDASSHEEVTRVDVGDEPLGVAVSPDGQRVYVATPQQPGPGQVAVVDTSTNMVTATVAVGFGPRGIAVTPDGKHVYVTNAEESDPGTVSVIDTSTNMVTATVPVGIEPGAVAITPDGSRAYVANTDQDGFLGEADDVSVIDTSTNMVVATISVGHSPAGIAVTPDGKRVYVTNEFGTNTSLAGIVSVIDAGSNVVVDEVPVGLSPISFGQFVGPPCPAFPFGCEDTGAVPRNPPTLRCEEQAARLVAKLLGAILKCHITAASSAFRQQTFDEDACETTAKAAFRTKVSALAGCPACLDPAMIGAQGEATLDAFNGRLFCAGDTPFSDGDDTGSVPPDGATERCERALATVAARLAAASLRCHTAMVRAAFRALPFGDDGCEAKAKARYKSASETIAATSLCPVCLGAAARAAIGDQVEAIVDGSNSLAYCANCASDADCRPPETCGGGLIGNVCGGP